MENKNTHTNSDVHTDGFQASKSKWNPFDEHERDRLFETHNPIWMIGFIFLTLHEHDFEEKNVWRENEINVHRTNYSINRFLVSTHSKIRVYWDQHSFHIECKIQNIIETTNP